MERGRLMSPDKSLKLAEPVGLDVHTCRHCNDNSTEICSACGVDEAMGVGPVPPERWWISGNNFKRAMHE